MAKVKIPLEMADGIKVRNIEELREHFDIKKVVGYFLDGKLHKWLEDRYYDDELDAIEKLDKSNDNLAEELCNIFNVEQDTSEIVIEEISKSNERLDVIREITDDDKLINQADRIARDQDELDKLVAAGEKKIYLLKGTFTIDLNYENVKYIGLENPVAYIPSQKPVPFGKKNIRFKDIEFDLKYKELEKMQIVKKPFAMSRDKLLYVDSAGKVVFARVGDLSYNLVKVYNNDVSDVLKDNSSEKRKVTVEKFFEDKSEIQIVGVCASGDLFGVIDDLGNMYTWNNDEKVNIVEGITDIIQIECGMNKYFALDKEGALLTLDKEAKKFNMSYDGKKFKQISVNYGLALGIDIDGNVVVISSVKEDSRLNIPDSIPPMKKIVVGKDAVYALSNEGKVYAWGNKYSCQIPEGLPEIIDIGMSEECTPILDINGTIHLCGRKEEIKAYKTKLKDMPKVSGVIGEIYDYIWCISTDNELYRNNHKMKLKRRKQDEEVITIYNAE